VDPAGHSDPGATVQVPLHNAVVRPRVDPNLPTGHAVHAAAPPVEYWPAGQAAVQVLDVAPVALPYRPALQLLQLLAAEPEA
jgi:hypothetical protein